MAPDISRNELQELIRKKGGYVLIDVRGRDELRFGAIPTSHNIPLPELGAALSLDSKAFLSRYGFSLEKSDLLIFSCRSGARSAAAAGFARAHGFNAVNYAGGILDWAAIDPAVQRY